MARIILVRHGETEWNRVERFRGRADVPLNQTGLFQAEVTGRRIAGEWRPVAIYSSPLSRAVRTAEAVAWHFDLRVEIHPGLIDIDYGEWQGLTPDEARARWPEVVDAWYNAPHTAHIPGGETLDDLRARALKTVDELSTLHKYRDQTIVLMGHTVVNRIILLGVLGLGNDHFWRLNQGTCAINVFGAEGGVFTIVRLNDTCHLRSRI
jgi:probable phosphoglycerate mutase